MRDLTERPLSSRSVFDGRLLQVRSDEVRHGNGSVHVREYVVFPRSVGIVPVLEDGRIVMIRQWRHPIGRWSYEIPGGRVDPGEEPDAAAARELREEAGLAPGWLRPLTRFGLAIGYSTEVLTLFLAGGLAPGRLPGDDDEVIEAAPCSLEEARARLERGEVLDSKTVIGLLLALALVREGGDLRDPAAPLPPGAGGLPDEGTAG